MDEPTGEEELRKQAELSVKERIHLFQHIGAFVIMNGFFVVIWALTTGVDSYPWWIWVTVAWVLGLAFHIVSYFTGARYRAQGPHDRKRDATNEAEVERGDRYFSAHFSTFKGEKCTRCFSA